MESSLNPLEEEDEFKGRVTKNPGMKVALGSKRGEKDFADVGTNGFGGSGAGWRVL